MLGRPRRARLPAELPAIRPLGTRGSRGGRREPAFADAVDGTADPNAYPQIHMMRRVLAIAAAAFIAVVAAACGPTATALPSVHSSAEATEGPAANLCPAVTLRGPDGSRVDLTGTWQGFASGLLFVTQTESCVAIEGVSNFPDEPLGTQWRSVFVGDLTGEFTVVGRWTWTYSVLAQITTGDTWAITMPIDFDDQDQPVIQIATTDVAFPDPREPRVFQTLVRISPSIAYPD